MSNFTAPNGRIERAKSLEDLSGVERRVLDTALTKRREYLARAAGTP